MAEAAGPSTPVHRRHSLGLTFSNPNIVYEKVLAFIFGTLGVRSETVVGIQFIKINKIIIKFSDEAPFRLFLEKHEGWEVPVPDSSGGGTAKIINLSQATSLVTVKNAPFEMENDKITTALGRYGRVLSIKKHTHVHQQAAGIQTGTRTVKMEVKHKIPASLTVSGYTLAIVYRDQDRACFKCGAQEHHTHDCDTYVRGKSVFYGAGYD